MSENMNAENSVNEKTPDLSVDIAGIHFRNPVIAASGTFGYGKEYSGIIDVSLLGGICTKGLTLTPRKGNAGTRIWETPSGLLNSIGLENPGIPSFLENELPKLKEMGPVVIANLSGASADEYVGGAALLDESNVDMIELNISCPNVKAGGIAFGLSSGTAAALTAAVRRVSRSKPLIVKLSPNAPNLASVAVSCINAGADALSIANTFQAMAIDTAARKPVFNNITAGLSGPAVRPLVLRMVWELFFAMDDARMRTPIIAVGGIGRTQDALEYLMAGASAVQVGSSTFAHPASMTDIIDGVYNYMIENKINNIGEISIRDKYGKDS